MKKKLILLRHGKTEDLTSIQKDIDRQLVPEGLQEAIDVSKELKHHSIDKIISSIATRAYKTATIVANGINYLPADIQIMGELYNPELMQLLTIIKSLPITENNILLVGHNPGFSEISGMLTGESNIRLATCEYSIIEFSCAWDQISFNSGNKIN